MHILVFGSTGLLGSALCAARTSSTRITGIPRERCDVTVHDQVIEVTATYRPDAVVNAAALPDTRSCESDPDRAWAVNALGARNVALAANTVGALCAQISGNIVFQPAAHARREWDRPDNPHGVLAATKTAAEGYTRTLARRPLVIRTASLFGDRPDGTSRGLVGRIRQQAADGIPLRMSADTVTDAAYAGDVADAVLGLLVAGHLGFFHLVNDGRTTPYDLAGKVLEMTGGRTAVTRTNGEAAHRLLSCDLAHACGIVLRPLDEALAAYLTPGR